jgi:hypothetical protein
VNSWLVTNKKCQERTSRYQAFAPKSFAGEHVSHF